LHVLQDRQVARLGGQETIGVSARLIAATNVDVEEAIRSGALRRDLYYRLNVFPIRMPPLCERAAEIPVLLWHFLRQYSAKLKRQTVTVSIDLLRAAVRYKWPGNVRELENFAKRHVILGDEEASIRQLTESPVGQRHIVPAAPAVSACEQGLKAFNRGLRDRIEKELITAALARTQWNRKKAARILGISYSALRSRILRMGLSRRRRLGNRPNNFQRTADTNSGLHSGVQLASTL
jgi:DNA-binding NtrC family response regulator